MKYFLFLFVVALSIGTIVIFSCRTMTQKEMAEAEDIPMNSDYDWMHRMDWYTGNVLVKFIESIASMVGGTLYLEMKKQWASRLGYLFMKPSFNKLWKKFDAAEYGGAPLLGLKGVSIVAHGSSSALAIRNAISAAADFRRSGAVEEIEKKMAELLEEEEETVEG